MSVVLSGGLPFLWHYKYVPQSHCTVEYEKTLQQRTRDKGKNKNQKTEIKRKRKK